MRVIRQNAFGDPEVLNAVEVASPVSLPTEAVNSWYLRDLCTPFGGVKMSGIGREGSIHSLNFYSEPSNICIKF